MSGETDFEQAWQRKLSSSLDQVAGRQVREQVMRGSETLSSASDADQVIAWTRGAMERLDSLLDEDQRRAVLTRCACQYPKTALQEMRTTYEKTGDVDLVHGMLQDQFESFLRESLELDDDLVQDILGRGWGLAGVKQGSRIVATKIPKSGHLVEFLREEDPSRRRQLYCHCPRVRAVLESSATISSTYCYCGAGFYKGIWEEILQEPVEVELLESLLQGDDVCKFAVHLPSSARPAAHSHPPRQEG